VVGAGKVGDAYVNAFGHLAGWVHLASGEYAGFRVRGWPDDPKPELFADFEPRTITDLGVLVGVCKGKPAEGPCFYDGDWPSLLPVKNALGAPLITLLGEAYGELATPAGVRAYRLAGDQVEELEGLGGETRVVAVNQAGDAVGWSLTPNKVHQAAIFRAGSGKAEPLGSLAGFANTEATGVSDRGWVVGTATDTKGAKRAFLAVPGKGMVALDARVTLPKGGKLELYEALSISRDGAIVAKGMRDGARGTFVLRPEK
jgi:probable HAF family extracellular repeat protein